MTVTIKFEDNDRVYTVDLLKLAPKLGITEDQIKQVVYMELAK